MKSGLILIVYFCLGIVLLNGCRDKSKDSDSDKSGLPSQKIVARVNDTTILQSDVAYLEKQGKIEGGYHETIKKNLIETIIQQELFFQKGVALGLDKDREYLEKTGVLEAQLRAMKRKEMADLVYAREIRDKTTIDDDEAKSYYDEHEELIQTEYHVLQLFYRGDKETADNDRKLIEQGTSFEEIAAKKFKDLPPSDRAPWDLGFLHWNQVPAEWRSHLYQLQDGAVSLVISGVNKRNWIIKLVEKLRNENMTFDKNREFILVILKNEKIQANNERFRNELKEEAKIVYN